MLLASDWSSLLSQVAVPTSIWHGDADTYVPISMGESLHQRIKGSSFHKVVGGGHFMILDTMDQVLEGIA
jgi:pimeloyl-ACP methyl ester carboxylesterase